MQKHPQIGQKSEFIIGKGWTGPSSMSIGLPGFFPVEMTPAQLHSLGDTIAKAVQFWVTMRQFHKTEGPLPGRAATDEIFARLKAEQDVGVRSKLAVVWALVEASQTLAEAESFGGEEEQVIVEGQAIPVVNIRLPREVWEAFVKAIRLASGLPADFTGEGGGNVPA